eukprot:maker-scaffold676_size113663-snap-gene-0.29 protein:Tk06499 transcript:maker-scaffold676_size113663-snap-gene-0.29-mRNA-1 annotation:"2 -phosphodiesterase 12-like"
MAAQPLAGLVDCRPCEIEHLRSHDMRLMGSLRSNLLRAVVSTRVISRWKTSTSEGYPRISRMEPTLKAVVKLAESETQFSFSFLLAHKGLDIHRQFNLSRPMDESASQFKTRLLGNLDKVLSKKQKKKKRKSEESSANSGAEGHSNDLDVSFSTGVGENIPLSDDVAMKAIFLQHDRLQMGVLGLTFDVLVNPPMVESGRVLDTIMVGHICYPYKLKLQFAEKSASQFSWFVSTLKIEPEKLDGKSFDKDKLKWSHRSTSYQFVPTEDDVGRLLKLVVTPSDAQEREGLIFETVSKNLISAAPGKFGYEGRQGFTQAFVANPDEFRVLTYNILADLYADSEYSRTVLHPQCPPYALEIGYRKQVILKELLGYHGDIMCLQEVDAKIFDLDLLPILAEFGYEGVFAPKGGSVNEGESCFWRNDKFELLSHTKVVLGESLKSAPYLQDIFENISGNEQLCANIDRSTVVQLVCLRSKEDARVLVVANTHMYFKPEADHIRLLQSAIIVREIEELRKALAQQYPLDTPIGTVLCGDFNSTPPCGVYQYLTSSQIPSDHPEWSIVPDEKVQNLTLKHALKFGSACGTPQYTNFTISFRDCLDYIFYETNALQVAEVVPFPSEEELTEFEAIPNLIFPSDHLACVATLKWNTAG